MTTTTMLDKANALLAEEGLPPVHYSRLHSPDPLWRVTLWLHKDHPLTGLDHHTIQINLGWYSTGRFAEWRLKRGIEKFARRVRRFHEEYQQIEKAEETWKVKQ